MKRLGITIGDVAGIGPEIILKALKKDNIINKVVIYGSYDVLSFYNHTFKYQLRLNEISHVNECEDDVVNIIDNYHIQMEDFAFGKLSAKCGDAAFRYLEKAINDANKKEIAAIVTAPLNKEALHLAKHPYAGHTEILAALTNTKEYSMLLWSDKIKVIHVSTHCSLRQAIDKCQKERIVNTTKLGISALEKANYQNYRIAIAGLNPHAGENGLFGDEEIKEIIPAVKQLQQEGINIEGPLSPDTIFLRAYKGEFDLVVAMYHDQGHIPLKMVSFDYGVNMTVGLPFIRTSVDHGTAFDIAGLNIADETSMLKAIEAAELFTN